MTRWQICRPGRLLWQSWDGQHLVYHTGSGDTLVLDDAGAAALRAVEAGLPLPPDQSDLSSLLSQLTQQDIIEPVP